MTMISQDEIVSNAKTVTKGLEALRQEHESILGGIKGAQELSDPENQENSLIQEKVTLIQRSLEMIELGLGEAHVMAALAGHLQSMEAEKQKLRSQVKRLCQENAWLRDELASTQQKLQVRLVRGLGVGMIIKSVFRPVNRIPLSWRRIKSIWSL